MEGLIQSAGQPCVVRISYKRNGPVDDPNSIRTIYRSAKAARALDGDAPLWLPGRKALRGAKRDWSLVVVDNERPRVEKRVVRG